MEKYLVWINGLTHDNKALPILCDRIEEVGNAFRLINPAVSFNHDGAQYDAIEWLINSARVNSYAKVVEHSASTAVKRVVVGEA
jgi:hypothetical protein